MATSSQVAVRTTDHELTMPPRSRYAVDPSLTAQARTPPPQQYDQSSDFQQQYSDPNVDPSLQPQPDYHNPAPNGPYAPSGSRRPIYTHHAPPSQPQSQPCPSYVAPANHIPPPPHSSGPQVAGPRVRIDPNQMPNPIEAQEMDQNLYDDEDFLSCQTRGVIPLAGTDWRGVDQGELFIHNVQDADGKSKQLFPAADSCHSACPRVLVMADASSDELYLSGNSLPRHLRATLPVIPTTSQLLDTTALPFALVIQPFAPLRYDEAPVPLVSNWVSGESAFDPPRYVEEEDSGPPRCEKCRGYMNPWIRWMDGGRKWGCNLCGASNNGELIVCGLRLPRTAD